MNHQRNVLIAGASSSIGVPVMTPPLCGRERCCFAVRETIVRALAGKARINAVAPALIEGSTMYDDTALEIRANHRSSTPTGTLVQIEDLASQLFDLCQPHWRSLNGACIDLNGGRNLR